MDCRGENRLSSDDVVHVVSGKGGNENWGGGFVDQAVWATEDEYGMWNAAAEASSYDGGREPPNKRSRGGSGSGSGDRSRAIGKMFYKTKLCCKFRAGTCPYITNCNFAHGVEELRKPPDNWQDIVAAHEEESSQPTEEFQIPIVGNSEETQRSYKGRHCKKFYTEEGCPYGESCTFLHDEHSKARESVAISLGPGSGTGSGYGGNASGTTSKPSNWKTRICNKWELTGYCPFGSKCHFAHGAAEMHHYGGGATDSEVPDAKQGSIVVRATVDTVAVSAVPHSEGYLMGIPSQRLSNVIQKTGQRPNQKWKGPDKISKIYGDWIDDL